MKKIVLASACILALALPAVAQTAQPSGGASSQGNVGPGASQGAMKDGTGTMNQGTHPAVTPALPAQTPRPASKTRVLTQLRVP